MIFEKFGLVGEPPPMVAELDNRILVNERQLLKQGATSWGNEHLVKLLIPAPIDNWHAGWLDPKKPVEAEGEFLSLFQTLFGT